MASYTVHIPLATIPEQPQAELEPDLSIPPPVYAPPAAAPPAYNAVILANLNNNNNNNQGVEEPAPKRPTSKRELNWSIIIFVTMALLYAVAIVKISVPTSSSPAPIGDGTKVRFLGMRMRGAEIEMQKVNLHAKSNVKTRAEIDADVDKVNARAAEVAAVMSAHSKEMHASITHAAGLLLTAKNPSGSAPLADSAESTEIAQLAELNAYLKSIIAGQDAHLSLLSRLASELPDDNEKENVVIV